MIQANDEWPDFPENENLFDWSLSMRKIEQIYMPFIPKPVKIVRPKLRFDYDANPDLTPVPEKKTKSIMNTIQKKYPYAYSQIDGHSISDEMWRWVYDNFLIKQL